MNSSAGADYTIGAELEFYICSSKGDNIADLTSGKFPQKRFKILKEFQPMVDSLLNELKTSGFDLSDESGPGQFEVQFKPNKDAGALAAEINHFKTLSQTLAVKHELTLCFAAKPFLDQCGSGLHIHYCNDLFDPFGLAANGGFMKQKNEAENNYILWAIGGMLANMNKHSSVFFPNEDSLKRITPYLNAPTKICWGRNNRSCAIRIPDSKPKRIEHRVAGADAEPRAVINLVIADADYGMANKIEPGDPVFGNAWDEQYKREAIV